VQKEPLKRVSAAHGQEPFWWEDGNAFYRPFLTLTVPLQVYLT
jgi:hypothetical protein